MKNILVIDDSISIRQVVSMVLKGAGFTVYEAIDGRDALAKLASIEKLNLIICDVNMSNMDGLSFVKAVKNELAYENFKFIPIIMLTTVSEEDKKLEGQKAGAKAWIVKPFLPEKLLAAVNKLIA